MIDKKFESWELLANILNKVLNTFDHKSIHYTGFESSIPPRISLYDYLGRIHKYSQCSDSCYILAFIYIDRALQMSPELTINKLNIHRLVLIAMVLSIKYLEDVYFDNNLYSKIGGIGLLEFNRLEYDMIQMINCKFYVDPELFFEYSRELNLASMKDLKKESIKNENSKNSFDTETQPSMKD